MNQIVDQTADIEAFCAEVQSIYTELARPITDDDSRYAELGPNADMFSAEERGELYALHHGNSFPVPSFITDPVWATRTKVAVDAYPEVTVTFEAKFGEDDMAVIAIASTTIFADDFENHDGTIDRRGTVYDESGTIDIILPEDSPRHRTGVSDLLEVQANVNALVDHLRAHGVTL